MEPRVRELLSELYAIESKHTDMLNSPEAVALKMLSYRDRKTEHFVTFLVDNKNHFLSKKLISKGTVDQAPVFPREILRYALLKQASGLILSHNHPGGDPNPSVQDREMPARIKKAAILLGIRLLDHVIVSRTGHYSFQEHGLL